MELAAARRSAHQPSRLNRGLQTALTLHLLVQPKGSKLWRLKYRFGGKEKLLSFGKYPEVTLAIARAKREEAKALLADGKDPTKELAARKKPPPPKTFEPIARAWHANRVDGLAPAHAARIISRMERDVFPIIGDRPIGEITAPEILDMIRLVEARGALDVSRRLKQGVSQAFRFAIASGWATTDPTLGLNDALKPKPPVKHMAHVPLTEFPGLVQARRRQWLVEQDLANDVDEQWSPRPGMIAALQRRELLRVADQLSNELGLPVGEVRAPEPIEGRLTRAVERSRDFTLVPWRLVLEQQIGKNVSGIMRDGVIHWSFGRQRSGPSIS